MPRTWRAPSRTTTLWTAAEHDLLWHDIVERKVLARGLGARGLGA